MVCMGQFLHIALTLLIPLTILYMPHLPFSHPSHHPLNVLTPSLHSSLSPSSQCPYTSFSLIPLTILSMSSHLSFTHPLTILSMSSHLPFTNPSHHLLNVLTPHFLSSLSPSSLCPHTSPSLIPLTILSIPHTSTSLILIPSLSSFTYFEYIFSISSVLFSSLLHTFRSLHAHLSLPFTPSVHFLHTFPYLSHLPFTSCTPFITFHTFRSLPAHLSLPFILFHLSEVKLWSNILLHLREVKLWDNILTFLPLRLSLTFRLLLASLSLSF